MTYAEYTKPVKKDLYYIGFGISDYSDPEINDLQFAHQDALDLASVFDGMEGDEYNKVYTRVYTNQMVTKKNITHAKAFLNNAKSDDTFVLFVSGHGKRVNSVYYYITYKTKLNNIPGTAIEFDAIEDLLDGIAPRNKLFLIDTCESGEIENVNLNTLIALSGQKDVRARGIIVKDKQNDTNKTITIYIDRGRYIYNDILRRTGTIIFASSMGGQKAWEAKKIKNGFFTEVIVDALTTTNTDNNQDGKISTNELQQYVSTVVPRMVGDQIMKEFHLTAIMNPNAIQNPTVDLDNIYIEFSFPLVKEIQ